MLDEENRQNVVVTDIHMPFLSMVAFMVKWAIAAIPAFIILTVIGVFTWAMLGGFLHSWTISKELINIVTPKPDANSTKNIEVPSPTSGPRTPLPAEESAYLGKVLVKGITVGPSTLGVKGVFGEVKNRGDRTLSEVEITIYYLDSHGKTIFEKSRTTRFLAQNSLLVIRSR